MYSSHFKSAIPLLDCEKTAGSYMWFYVLVGNLLRGIGETPIMPLGVSYVDDFSREENTPFYLGELLLQPVFYFKHHVHSRRLLS